MLRRVILFLTTMGCFASLTSFSVEKPAIPKDLLFERKPLSPDVNAYTEWIEADKVFIRFKTEDEVSILKSVTEAWPLRNTQNFPAFPAVEAWIHSNSPALALVEKGLGKERAQCSQSDFDKLAPFLMSAKMLARARLFLAEQAASKSDNATATNLILGNFKLARMMTQADVPVINYLVARGLRSSTDKALADWAWLSKASPEMIRNVLKSVPALDDEPDIYEHVLRVEFTEFISANLDLKKIQKLWIDAARTNEAVLMLQPEGLQRAILIVHDPRLLALHPKPLDIEESSSYDARLFRKLILNARNAWRPGSKEALSAETEQVRVQFVKELQPLLKATDGEEVPLSEKAAKKAAKHYLKLTNPVGRYWRSSDLLTRTFVTVFQSRTEREATRALLALRIYELEHDGRRAESLDDLVKAGLLDRLPMDFFSNAPLHYSAEKRMLWSVGEDGVDSDGVQGKPAWQEKDMVWQIPTVKTDQK